MTEDIFSPSVKSHPNYTMITFNTLNGAGTILYKDEYN